MTNHFKDTIHNIRGIILWMDFPPNCTGYFYDRVGVRGFKLSEETNTLSSEPSKDSF